MALTPGPWLAIWLIVWMPLAVLTTIGSFRRGETAVRAAAWGLAFPITWVRWFVIDNHAAGRKAFRSR